MQLGLHRKPVALYNRDGFWDAQVEMLDRMVAEGFKAPRFRAAVVVASTPDGLLDALARWRPRTPKWSDRPGGVR